MRITRCRTQNAVQSMFIILGRRHRLLHVRHFLRKGTEENKKFVQYTMDLLSIPNYCIKKGRPHGHRYGKKPGDRILHRPFTQEEVQKEELLGYPRPIHTRQKAPQEHD